MSYICCKVDENSLEPGAATYADFGMVRIGTAAARAAARGSRDYVFLFLQIGLHIGPDMYTVGLFIDTRAYLIHQQTMILPCHQGSIFLKVKWSKLNG